MRATLLAILFSVVGSAVSAETPTQSCEKLRHAIVDMMDDYGTTIANLCATNHSLSPETVLGLVHRRVSSVARMGSLRQSLLFKWLTE